MAKKSTPQPKPKIGDRFNAFVAGELIGTIQKKYGQSILTRAQDYTIQRVPRIPSRIFALDYALGGGFPAGRINIVWGNKSTGKSLICTRALATAQDLCANCYTPPFDPATGEVGSCACGNFREHVCAYLDVEGTFDQEWAALHGVDTSRLLLSVPEYAEQTLDIGEALLRSTEIDLLVIDSLAFMAPANEIKESTAKALQAEQARVLGRGIRKFVAALNAMGNQKGRRPTILFTNQVRLKVGLMFGNPETQPGGKASGFSATTETKTWGGKFKTHEDTGVPLEVELGFKVEKNKSANAGIEGEWRINLRKTSLREKGSIIEEHWMVDKAKKIGLVKRDGSGWSCLGEKYRSQSVLETELVKNAALKQQFGEALANLLWGVA
jgi:recombination protein RecA